MRSIWSDTVTLPTFEPLNQDIKTDVLIIGGGITGILCAYMLEQAHVDYVLVEAKEICSGVTENTTAKITSQHGMIYHKMLKRFGTEKTRLYLDANEKALAEYRKLCKNIACDFETKDNFVYTLSDMKKLEQELEALHELQFPAQHAANLPLPFATAVAVKFVDQAQFHPLKFLAKLAEGLRIFEHTKVQELKAEKNILATTPHGTITADKVIVATHFPFLNKHGMYFLKMYQHRSYVLALEKAPFLDGMYVDEAQTGLSFRNYDNLLLVGGGSHRTGKHGGNWAELSALSQTWYPDATESYRWATQDCMPLDDIPYIGQYSPNTPNLYVATGFHKWGMTSAMVAATLLRDLVLEKENPYVTVFNPSRTMIRPQLFVNAFETATNLLTFTKKRCPHMGCALKWNPHEHTWDCACHGSRFTEDGAVINNPATDDLVNK
jgi:glycine/D-amino acid oxidase-like deaminating enzyme